ncbi:translation initiation factor IF3-4, chloroplastic [Malania oleifera]|uniref:translation initiation factor IF3-4, chloroplastic n=1 Tax=Malania oleifera TaxID=397392 RepID=UPI0025AE062E|nr:translation initiation factor IF3-4, chloroplastic [Malania oleifera]
MAGLTSSYPFNPLLSRTRASPSPYPLSLSSFQSSKLFGLRLHNAAFSQSDSLITISSRPGGPIFARYGGRSVPSRFPRRDSDDDRALDISGIRSASVRLIDEQQNMVGVMSKSEALQMAEDAELDLVILSPDADPPVVRIMDYSKYRYEQQKKKKGQQKKANRMDLKELKMGYNIDSHDYSVRLKAAKKFLKDGHKVKVIVNLKGRENEFRNIAVELIKRFQNDVGEVATEESKNFRERNMNIVLVPNKLVLQKAQEQKAQEPPKKSEKSMTTEVSAAV